MRHLKNASHATPQYLAALVALERTFTRVDADVFEQVTVLGKGAVAFGALERLVATVDALVGGQRGAMRKYFLAMVALVYFLHRVVAHVCHETTLVAAMFQ